jgi:hypothetical protein
MSTATLPFEVIVLSKANFNMFLAIQAMIQITTNYDALGGEPRPKLKEVFTANDKLTELEFDELIDAMIANHMIRVDEHDCVRLPLPAA